jgi:hypothetical protein
MTLTTARLTVVATSIACLSAMPAAQKKPNTTTPVRLTVEVADAGMRIQSDMSGPYVDGEPGVSASFDQYGSLIIALGPIRTFCYDYSLPVDGQPASPTSPMCPGNTYVATSGLGGGVTKKFQDLGHGEAQCIRGEPTYTLPDAKKTLYRHLFQRSANGMPAEETYSAYLLATRTADLLTGQRTWTVESVNTCLNNPNSGIARVVSSPQLGKYQLTDWHRYDMPMKLTLTEIN